MLKRRAPENDDNSEIAPLNPAQQAQADESVRRMEAGDRQRELAARRSDKWREKLIVNGQGVPKTVLANAITALRLAPEWQSVLMFDEFALVTRVQHSPPWEGGALANRAWTPIDDLRVTDWLQHQNIMVGLDVASQAVETVARDEQFHPVRDYLNSVRWDGRPRVATWLTSHLGVERSDYADAVGQRLLISAVARVMQPGCKADAMLIIEGPQGAGKSKAIDCLVGQWFSDELSDIGTKDASLQLGGAWVFELSELDAMQRSDIAKLKAFLSRRTDRFRPPYGRRVIEVPRQCVFIGTTNSESYLRDETGARRFWPVKAHTININAIERDRDQLWAEAVDLYRAGHAWWIDSSDIATAARQQQDERYSGDPWDDAIAKHIEYLRETSVGEILREVFHIEPAQWKQGDQNRVARSLTSLGWIKYQHRNGARREWRYRRLET
jgi:predicted P-loop ATPase